MRVPNYIVLFAIAMVNLFLFVGVLQRLSVEVAIVQIFVLFAYLIITALVLWGSGNRAYWSPAAGAALFLAQIVNVGILHNYFRPGGMTLLTILALIAFLYNVVFIKTRSFKPLPVEPEPEFPEAIVEKYGTRGASSKKTATKKPAKRKKTTKKASVKKKTTKKKTKR